MENKLHTEIITLCDYATISREGKLSIAGIFDELHVNKFPGGIARAFFVATCRGKSNSSYNIKVVSVLKGKLKEKELSSIDIAINTSENGKNNIILELVNLGFENEGVYEFIIYQGLGIVGKTQLQVRAIEEKSTFQVKN